jgi:hypothetical protein
MSHANFILMIPRHSPLTHGLVFFSIHHPFILLSLELRGYFFILHRDTRATLSCFRIAGSWGVDGSAGRLMALAARRPAQDLSHLTSRSRQGPGQKGGPGGYIGWVCVGWVRKVIRFWQKHSPNCDFLVLHSPSTLCTSKNI